MILSKHLLFSVLLFLLKPLSIPNEIETNNWNLRRQIRPSSLEYYVDWKPLSSLRESLNSMTIHRPINKTPTLLWTNAKGKDFSYEVTNNDKLTLYRSCAHEGNPQHAVCWSLLQRFTFIYPKYKSLTSFLINYVQPINPTWFIDGSKHLAYITRLKKAYKSPELEIKIQDAERRAVNRKKFSTAIVTNKKYISIVEDIFNSSIPSPNNSIIHYCASFADTNETEIMAKKHAISFGLKRDMVMVDFGQSFLPGTNWFFSTKKSSNFKLRIQ